MTHTFKPIDLANIKTVSLSKRKSKVTVDDFAKPLKKGSSIKNFLDNLPDILAGKNVRSVISAIANASLNNKIVLFGMGAHVIKVGLNPIVIDLMERGIISAVAMNGAGIIHDLEVALDGKTSEEVNESIDDGSFGMTRETCDFIGKAITAADKNSKGLGESVGQIILENDLKFKDKSILAAGNRLGIPITIHIAIGTDIIHMHPDFDPKSAGLASHRDFRTFASIVSALEGGVYLNVGSAVLLPEVFLKAITLVRNLGHDLKRFTTVNMDFIQHYRPLTNVVNRPTQKGGQGFNLVGHHEIMLPIIAAGVIEEIDE
ncbi:MAG: hypothetical protein JRJ76_16745 [Deltaproteobacteria bacterium]|nr:hypothetical protein [Deltaproteobacteria bacterium]